MLALIKSNPRNISSGLTKACKTVDVRGNNLKRGPDIYSYLSKPQRGDAANTSASLGLTLGGKAD